MYTHQAQAFRSVNSGRDIVVVTPTASGKTLCYNLPVLNHILDHPESRALYLFPTKALAQDQVAELMSWGEQLGETIKTYTYDGDTAAECPPGNSLCRQYCRYQSGYASFRNSAPTTPSGCAYLRI